LLYGRTNSSEAAVSVAAACSALTQNVDDLLVAGVLAQYAYARPADNNDVRWMTRWTRLAAGHDAVRWIVRWTRF
jgi:hypothetical protein